MSKADRAVYEEALKLTKAGFLAPLLVKQDDIQG